MLKCRVNPETQSIYVIRSPKQVYQCPHKKTDVLQKCNVFFKKKEMFDLNKNG